VFVCWAQMCCVAVCCSVLQCVAVWYTSIYTDLWIYILKLYVLSTDVLCCSVLQCVAVCCSVIYIHIYWSINIYLETICVEHRCVVLQCVAVCCSVIYIHIYWSMNIYLETICVEHRCVCSYMWLRQWVCHDAFMSVPWRIYECDMTSGMGWLRFVGSLKIYVFFAEYPLFYRALLQKRPMVLRSLLVEATPYICV